MFDVGEATPTGAGVERARPVQVFVMEYLQGESLASRLRNGPLPIDRVLPYAIEIASALDAAHRHGIIHRDLKPGNIMLTPSGARLLDFGLAKRVAAVAGPDLRDVRMQPDVIDVASVAAVLA